MLTNINIYWIAFFLSLLVIGFTIWKTAVSPMSKDRKLAVYITVILIPVVGILLYFIFRASGGENGASRRA
jgi:hypothetical protein